MPRVPVWTILRSIRPTRATLWTLRIVRTYSSHNAALRWLSSSGRCPASSPPGGHSTRVAREDRPILGAPASEPPAADGDAQLEGGAATADRPPEITREVTVYFPGSAQRQPPERTKAAQYSEWPRPLSAP